MYHSTSSRVRHVHRARNYQVRRGLSEIASPTVHEIPWQIGNSRKAPLRGRRPEPAGPAVKTTLRRRVAALKDEHLFLLSRERPQWEVVAWAASKGPSENADYLYGKRRLGQIDSRIRFSRNALTRPCHRSAAPRPVSAATRVFFGATVTYKTPPASNTSSRSSHHEVDLDRGYISWRSLSPMRS